MALCAASSPLRLLRWMTFHSTAAANGENEPNTDGGQVPRFQSRISMPAQYTTRQVNLAIAVIIALSFFNELAHRPRHIHPYILPDSQSH